MNAGIDYGLGRTNIDRETGIRYGVISSHAISQAWCDSSEPEYGPPHCPKCYNQADRPEEFGDTFKDPTTGEIDVYDFDGADDYTDEHHEEREFVCVNCQHFFGSESAFGDDPIGHYLKDADYTAESCLDSDVIVIKSPFYTYAPFCSPCVPGACSIDNGATPTEPLPADWPKAYCLGHDWFDDGKAPYRLFRVADDSEVLPE